MLLHFLRIGYRNILKRKATSVINLVGLALGMVSCIYISAWVQDELGWDRFHANYDRLHRFYSSMSSGVTESTPLALVPTLRDNYPEIAQLTRFSPKRYSLRSGDLAITENGALVDREFFDMFTFPFLKGDIGENFDASRSMVITERLANKIFLNGDPVGRSLMVEGGQEFTVTGIVRDVPENSHIQFDYLLPIRQMRAGADRDWSYDCVSYLTLRDNADLAVFREKMIPFIRDNDTMDVEVALRIQPLRDIHLHALSGTDPVTYIYIFAGLALVILFIACVNVINLSASQSVFRAREIGLRKVVGAGRRHIVAQFMGESITLSLLALLLAMTGAGLLYPLLNELSGKQITFSHFISGWNIAGALGLSLLTGLVAGSYPAFLLSSLQPVRTVKGKMPYTRGSRALRRCFVAGQFIVTVILMVTTLSMNRQLDYIRDKDLGFNRDQVVSVPMSSEMWQNFKVLKEQLGRNSGIAGVTAAYNNPTEIRHTNVMDWEGNGAGEPVSIKDQSVDVDYFHLFEMQLVEGRVFSEEYSTDIGCFVLNEAAAELLGTGSTVGKQITVWRTAGPVIGVVKNFHSASLHEEIEPIVFMTSERHGPRTRLFVKLSPRNITGTLGLIEETVAGLAPGSSFEYAFLDDVFAAQYARDLRLGALYRVFTFLATFISCMGLYGLVSLALSGRIREIGIRKVMGATVPRIISLVLNEFLILICISTLIGWSVGYVVTAGILDNYAYQAGISPWVFVAAWLLIFFLAVVSVGGRVTAAALARPVDSLRHE
jgi:ABC-type antimicrobial peptide transport system permease subunit